MQKYKIEEYLNEKVFNEYETTADSEFELSVKLAPQSNIRFGTQLIKSLKLKGTSTEVHLNHDGVFFYFDTNGEEVVMDDLNINWLLEPVGAYHSEMLKQMDIETIVYSKI